MKKSGKIFFAVLIFFFAGHICMAQAGSTQKDTLTVKLIKSESAGNTKNQNMKEINDKQAGAVENNGGSRIIKQVKTARPDMSKARGARPPDIVRPTGSRIPKGVGKPG